MFSPVMTLITKTSVVTARMTPSKVRKLRSLCARRASITNFNVSTIVTQAVRMPAALDGLLVTARGAISVIRPMGVTPKQTSNLLCVIRVRSSNRSLLYRRWKRHFAFGFSWSSLTPGSGQSLSSGGRPTHCTALWRSSGKKMALQARERQLPVEDVMRRICLYFLVLTVIDLNPLQSSRAQDKPAEKPQYMG